MILLAETTITWHAFFFWLFAILACGFGLGVLFSGNIVRMALYLILSLGATAGLFFLAGAHFLGAMQLMIYVGGTLVLLIFGVMLTAQERFVQMKTASHEWVVAALVGGAILGPLLFAAFSLSDWRRPPELDTAAVAYTGEESTAQLGLGLIGVRVDRLESENEVLAGGMSGYLLLFEVIAVHLLVVLVGAAYLARTRRRLPLLGAAASQAPPVTDREHSTVVTFVLMLAIFLYIGSSIFCLVGSKQMISIWPELGNSSWMLPMLAFINFINAALVMVVFRWQRWGFFALCVSGGIEFATLMLGGAGLTFALVSLGIIVVWIAILFAFLRLGGAESTWARLD